MKSKLLLIALAPLLVTGCCETPKPAERVIPEHRKAEAAIYAEHLRNQLQREQPGTYTAAWTRIATESALQIYGDPVQVEQKAP